MPTVRFRGDLSPKVKRGSLSKTKKRRMFPLKKQSVLRPTGQQRLF